MADTPDIDEQIAAVERALAMVREFASAGEGLLGDAPTLRTIAGLEGALATLQGAPRLVRALRAIIEPFVLISDATLREFPDTPQPIAILAARAALASLGAAGERE